MTPLTVPDDHIYRIYVDMGRDLATCDACALFVVYHYHI